MSTIPFTLTLSLFDSLSTAQQIIIFILLLTTLNPVRNSIAYLVGLSGAYIACGIGGYLALGKLHVFLSAYVPSTANVPDALYYQSELVAGIVMTLIGAWYFSKKRHAPPDRVQNMMVSRFKSMSGLFAFLAGAFISASSFPVSIPYIIALDKYGALHTGLFDAMGNILLYNFGYALPMIAVFFAYLYARRRSDDLSDALQEKTRVLNVHLTTWAWAGLGIFSLMDALCYLITGQALVRGRYF
jgi:cytochrome c biogenesis protein CcdA